MKQLRWERFALVHSPWWRKQTADRKWGAPRDSPALVKVCLLKFPHTKGSSTQVCEGRLTLKPQLWRSISIAGETKQTLLSNLIVFCEVYSWKDKRTLPLGNWRMLQIFPYNTGEGHHKTGTMNTASLLSLGWGIFFLNHCMFNSRWVKFCFPFIFAYLTYTTLF